MQEVKKVLDQLMDTPAVELVNLKNDDIIKTEALIACSRYGNPQSKKDLGDVTYRDFLRSFFQFYRKNLKDQGLVFSFVYDWAYLIESSPILQKFNDLDYNKCVEVASEAIANEKALDAFISGVNNKVSLELQSRISNPTVGTYIDLAAQALLSARDDKLSKEEYKNHMDCALDVTYFNLFNMLYAYAEFNR